MVRFLAYGRGDITFGDPEYFLRIGGVIFSVGCEKSTFGSYDGYYFMIEVKSNDRPGL